MQLTLKRELQLKLGFHWQISMQLRCEEQPLSWLPATEEKERYEYH